MPQAQFLYIFMYQLKINVIKSLNNLSCIYKYHCDILLLLSRQKTDCSPGASQFINYSSSRIFLASKEYLIFGSKTDPLRVNNILKDPPGTAGASVVCKRGWFTLQGAGTTAETWSTHTRPVTAPRPTSAISLRWFLRWDWTPPTALNVCLCTLAKQSRHLSGLHRANDGWELSDSQDSRELFTRIQV